jgi:hypothetical protein
MYLLYLDIRMWRTAGYQALVPIRACNRPHRLAGISAGAPYQFDESEGRGLFGSILAALLTALACFFSTRRAQ